MNISPTEQQSTRSLVTSLYASLASGDLDGAMSAMSHDVVLHVPGSHPLAGEHRGPSGVIGVVVGSRAVTEGGEHIEIVDVLEGERHAAVYCIVTATRPGRPPLENRTVHLMRIADDRIVEIWLHNFDDLTVNQFWT